MRFIWLILLAACGWETTSHYYATDFDLKDGRHMLAWPADAGASRFRYVVAEGHDLKTSDIRSWPRGRPRDVASVTVVLDEAASQSVRDRSRELLDAVLEDSRNASMHVVFDSEPWSGYEQVEQVDRRLAALRRRAKSRRPDEKDPFAELFEGLAQAFVAMLVPDFVLVPHAGSDGFLLATYGRNRDGAPGLRRVVETDLPAIVSLAREPREDRTIDMGINSVLVLRTAGTPDARCLVAVEALGALEGVRVAYATASETFESFARPDDFAKLAERGWPGPVEAHR